MKEVSCRVLDPFFRELRRGGRSPELLLAGTRYSLPDLRQSQNRIDWSEFVQIMRNAGQIWTSQQFVELGGSFMRSPLIRAFTVVARLLFSTRDFYLWIWSGIGHHFFTCVEGSLEETGPNRMVLELRIHEGYETFPEYFLVAQGSIIQLPCILGFPPAEVRMSFIEQGARFEVVYPEGGGTLSWLRKAVTWPFTARAAARELKEAHEVLQARYQELAQAHEELADYRQNLERKVQERTCELQRARDELADTVVQLQTAQAARDRFFANINHEIRTPLSLVTLSVAEVRRCAQPLDPRVHQALAAIDSSVHKLLRLIDALLLLAAKQENKLQLHPSACDLAVALQLLASAWAPAAQERGLALGYQGPRRYTFHTDEMALERIVTNLVSNAIKFTPHGGHIEVELAPQTEGVALIVRDSGVGIDDELQKRLFGRFEQGQARLGSGSGIGLSLVKELAEAQGGRVSVENRPEGGSIFQVFLPYLSAPAHEERAMAVPRLSSPQDFGCDRPSEARSRVLESNQPGAATILVAEDDGQLREAIGRLLGGEYRVLLASDGQVALELAEKSIPDLLVSDIGMPGMDGRELTQRFRRLPANRLAPVILLTAHGQTIDRLAGFEAGAIDYVLKPFDPEELRARIRSHLALRNLALKLHETEKLSAIGALSTSLAHEIRNPANAIVNAIEPLRNQLPPELLAPGTPTAQLLEVLSGCASQVALFSRQLLGLRRSGEIERQTLPFSTVLSGALAQLQPALASVTLHEELAYDGPLWCAAPLVTQLLTNLLDNALYAARPGGWIKLASRREGDRLVVEVSDSGPGIPPEFRERIFEPFFTTKPPGIGTGLGLATVREIVDRHQGTIRVAEGSLFQVELPIGPAI